MKHNIKICAVYSIAFCSLLFTIPTFGQTEFSFENARPLYVGARALSLGNAYTAIANDATSGFWNPAGLIQWQGIKLFGLTKLYDRSDYRFDPKGIGFSWRGNGFYWGNKIALGVASGVPDYNYYCFARQIGSYAAIGLSLKFKRRHPSDYYQFFGYHTSYDIGMLFKPNSNLKIGCLLQNLEGHGFQWVTLGTAYRYARFQFSADIAISTRDEKPEYYLGAEWVPLSLFSLRIGNSNGFFTCGVGFHILDVHIHYARIFETSFASDYISAELSF